MVRSSCTGKTFQQDAPYRLTALVIQDGGSVLLLFVSILRICASFTGLLLLSVSEPKYSTMRFYRAALVTVVILASCKQRLARVVMEQFRPPLCP